MGVSGEKDSFDGRIERILVIWRYCTYEKERDEPHRIDVARFEHTWLTPYGMYARYMRPVHTASFTNDILSTWSSSQQSLSRPAGSSSSRQGLTSTQQRQQQTEQSGSVRVAAAAAAALARQQHTQQQQ